MVLRKVLIISLATLLGWMITVQSVTSAAPLIEGDRLFELHCAGCHINGGNIIRRNKTLKLEALKRNHMDSLAAIAQIITFGKANMSAYQDRLTSDEIQAIAAYVLEQARQGWKS